MKKKIIAYVVSAVMVLTMVPATAFAATGTDDSGMSKTAVPTIDAQKAEAVGQIEDLNVPWLYDSANATKVQDLVTKYVDEVNAETVTTYTQIATIVSSATTEIGKIDTARDIIVEYWRSGNAGSSTGLFDSEANYSFNNWLKVKGYDITESESGSIRWEAMEDLEEAQANEDAAAVNAVITQFKADIDAVPLVGESVSADLATAKEEAIEEINSIFDDNAYPGATYAGDGYNSLLQAQINAINSASTTSAVSAAKTTATTLLENYINNTPTEAQTSFNTAVMISISSMQGKYAASASLYDATYSSAFNKEYGDIKKPASDGDGYYGKFYEQMNTSDPTEYNKAVRGGDYIFTQADITDVEQEIAYNIGLIPTKAELENVEGNGSKLDPYTAGVYYDWAEAVDGLYKKAQNNTWSDEQDYATLKDLQAEYKAFSNKNAFVNLYVLNNTTGWNTLKVWYGHQTYDKLLDKQFIKIAGTFNAWQEEQILELMSKLPSADSITKDNYLDVQKQIDAIDARAGRQISESEGAGKLEAKNAAGIAAADATDKGKKYEDAIDVIASIRETGTDFINAEENLEVDTTEEGFAWNFAEEGDAYQVWALKDQYEALKGDMLEDDKIKVGIVTLSEAMDVYSGLLDSVKETKTAIDSVNVMIGNLKSVITLADKDAIDAAWDAYNALPEGSKPAIETGEAAAFYGYGTCIEFGEQEPNGDPGMVSLIDKTNKLVASLDASVKTALDAAGISSTNNWNKVTASIVELYDTIVKTYEKYGEGVDYGASMELLEDVIEKYNTEASAAIEANIIAIPNDPDKITEDDFADIKEAREDYDALLTDEAKENFKRSGYLGWLEEYEAAMGVVEADYDLANATVTILGPCIEGGLPYVARGTTPEIEVKDANGDVIPATAYTVDCNEAHPAGKTSVIIRANDGSGYTGENEAAYVVVNNKKSIKSLTGAKKSFTVKYSDYSKHGCTGTEIAWKTSKNGEWKFSKITSNKASKKITVKAAGKKYVRVRAIVKVDGIRYYSDWSKTKTVTVK